MGVPKFFRYISERYPCLSELVKEYQIPEFDNLYLDMNGIIHMCSHPDDFDPHFRISEEKMFGDIFHYIEVLFRMIKPQKLFFMAVDGVAPRAKMNQQRGRRFRSAKDAEVLEAKARERGEDLPSEARFDSNCITPGTVFMDRLQQQLKYFVTNKISTDSLWQHCKIILSGHETPGEGEHKIMDYIRYMKAQPGYDPNTRHCLYGLDADLIMLGLCSHEPHFSLLREEVRFGKKAKRKNIPEHITFYLLHLSLMREYLELEFMPLKESLPFEYDMEKIIDDWVLMGFLVGNDFIPNLPNLHIANGALPILYNAYMKILPTLNGYINEAGVLNLERFEKFMVALAAIDMDNFSEQYADLKYFQSKTGRRPNEKERTSYRKELIPWDADDETPSKKTTNPELEALIKSTDQFLEPKKTGWDDEITTVSEIKFKPPKNSDLQALINSTNDMFSDSTSSSSNIGVLIEPLEEMNLEQQIENEEVDKIARGFIGELLEKAVGEIKQENSELQNDLNKVVTKAEIVVNEQKNLVEINEFNSQKATEVVLVEPSQSNLDDLALDLIDLDDEDEDIHSPSPYYSECESDESDELMEAEFKQHKNDYYMNKLDYSKVTADVMRSQAEGYVRAIQWNLFYYYEGCRSWSWYYPHHYAPYISDIRDFANMRLDFDHGRPFHPFEQLLAVLPAASRELLPEVYRGLMVDEGSPILEYYPQDFKTDLNGKKQEWEAVVLIPFIAENLLLDSMAPCNALLSPDELRRNSHGPMYVYEYTKEDLGSVEAPEHFPPVLHSHAQVTLVTAEDIRVPSDKLVKGPCPGAITDTYYPGFPTFKHLEYTGTLEKAKVKVFDQPSQNENMIITIKSKESDKETNLKELAKELIGKHVFVAWPHLTEALVVAVSDCDSKIMATSTPGEFSTEINRGNLGSLWHTMKNTSINHYMDRLGIETGKVSTLVHVKGSCGQKYVYTQTGSISVEKQWNAAESVYPLQAVVRQLNVSVSAQLNYSNVQELFPLGSTVFMLGHPHYGAMGEVIDNTTLKSGRVKVSMSGVQEPDFSSLYKYQQELKYLPAGVASQRLAITPHLLSRVTGSIFVSSAEKMNDYRSGRVNIGLNLKLNKKNEEIPGYTKKVEGQWLYSPKAIQLVKDYMNAYPNLFRFIQSHLGNDVFNEQELFPGDDSKSKVKEVAAWLKSQPYASIEHQQVGSQIADPEIVKKIEEIVDSFNGNHNLPKQIIMQVKPHLLYKPDVQTGFLPPDITTIYRLYDRVVNVREGYTVPYGCKGTIIGIQASKGVDDIEVMYDVIFDQQFAGGLTLNCSPGRGYRVPKPALINITHGMRIVQQKTVNPVTNSPWYGKQPPVQGPPGPRAPVRPPRAMAPNTQGSAFVNLQMHQTQCFPGAPVQMRPQAPFQQPPLRPPGGQRGPGAEFHAFFQDLQRNQAKQVQPQNFPSQSLPRPPGPFQTQGFTPSAPEQGATDETEALRKLLKISEKQPASGNGSSAPANATQPFSVQDFFAHARNQEQKSTRSQVQPQPFPRPPTNQPNPVQPNPTQSSPYFCVQLLNYCQANGAGIPRYNYYTAGDRCRAQIVLSDGRSAVGDEAASKADASESAARVIMTEIINGKNQSQNGSSLPPNWDMNKAPNLMNPSGFPSPPKQWCQKDNAKPRRASPQKHRGGGQQKPEASFVPLQAVKQNRPRGNGPPGEASRAPRSSGSVGRGAHSPSKAKPGGEKQKNTQSEASHKPRQRKSRIAANFSAVSPPQ